MFAVILGGGLFGKRMIELFMEKGWKVSVIERDPVLAEKIVDEYGISVIQGDGTDPYILEQAGIEKADVFIASTSKEDANTLAAIIAKEYNVPKIIVRISKSSYVRFLEKIDIGYVIVPEEIAANYVFDHVFHPDIKRVVEITDDSNLVILKITKDINVIGKKLSEVRGDEFKSISLVKKDGRILTDKKSLIEEGDVLIIISFMKPEKLLKKLT